MGQEKVCLVASPKLKYNVSGVEAALEMQQVGDGTCVRGDEVNRGLAGVMSGINELGLGVMVSRSPTGFPKEQQLGQGVGRLLGFRSSILSSPGDIEVVPESVMSVGERGLADSKSLGSSKEVVGHSFTSKQNKRREQIRLGKRPVNGCLEETRRSRSCGQGSTNGASEEGLSEPMVNFIKKRRKLVKRVWEVNPRALLRGANSQCGILCSISLPFHVLETLVWLMMRRRLILMARWRL